MTCITSGTSIPRPRTSVPSRTLMRPDLKSPSAASRSRWSLSPCTDAHGQPMLHRSYSSWSAERLVLTKTMVLPSIFWRRSTKVRDLSRPSTKSTSWVTVEAAPPTRPTRSMTGWCRNESAMRTTFLGNVAENIMVWRPSCGMSARSTILRICGSKPMSSMRSASSSTRKVHCERVTRSRPIISSRRPGVATSTSHPRSSSRICSPKGEPP
mmetsp:Transcript_109785/g.319363  ORF Transcript_109785/g.319363 Transcript_109785/m.319363 type:complete len:211 (-) Transcript_109785:567-1199(-)